MPKLLLTTAALAFAIGAAATVGTTTARADANAPYCATMYRQSGSYLQCDFYTFAQCQATVSGLAGSCSTNPYLRESLARMPRSR